MVVLPSHECKGFVMKIRSTKQTLNQLYCTEVNTFSDRMTVEMSSTKWISVFYAVFDSQYEWQMVNFIAERKYNISYCY